MPKHLIGNRDLIRAINRSTVLNTVKSAGPLSRTEVSQLTGLSAATITAIANELIDSNLIFEKEEGSSSGGRRPILLALNPRGGFVIGTKLTEDYISAALTDLEATILARKTTHLENTLQETVLDSFCRLVNELLETQLIARGDFYGVGVGLAGIVDAERGMLRQSPIFGWEQVPLSDLLQDCLGAPVYIDNDVNTLTLTELWFGRGQDVDNFLTVTVGRGVGLGIVLDGKLYTGAHGGAGEFGHTLVSPDGPLCACGKRGCLEMYISDPALVARAREAGLEINEIQALVDLAEAGSPQAQALLADAGDLLGRSLANLVNVLVPQLIILSGEGVRAGDWFFEPMRRSLRAHTMPSLAGDFDIEVDQWDEYAWARGAASLVLRELFENPAYREQTVF